jgi:hypothetical protein
MFVLGRQRIYSPTRYATMACAGQPIREVQTCRPTSRECTLVLKLLNRTCSTLPLSIRCGSASPQDAGMAISGESSVYAKSVNEPASHQSHPIELKHPLTRFLEYRQEGDARGDLLHDFSDLPLHLLLRLFLFLFLGSPTHRRGRFSRGIFATDIELPAFERLVRFDRGDGKD